MIFPSCDPFKAEDTLALPSQVPSSGVFEDVSVASGR